jgi:hypothetical protein
MYTLNHSHLNFIHTPCSCHSLCLPHRPSMHQSLSFCFIALLCLVAQKADISSSKVSCSIPPSCLFHDLNSLSTVISKKISKFPSERIPAGIYVFIDLDLSRRWKLATGILSSDESIAWADTVTLYKFIETFKHNSRTDFCL